MYNVHVLPFQHRASLSLKLSSSRRLMVSIAVSIPFARRRESVAEQLFQLVMLKLTCNKQHNRSKRLLLPTRYALWRIKSETFMLNVDQAIRRSFRKRLSSISCSEERSCSGADSEGFTGCPWTPLRIKQEKFWLGIKSKNAHNWICTQAAKENETCRYLQ